MRITKKSLMISVLCIAGAIFCLNGRFLAVSSDNDGWLYLRPVSEGDRFTIRFIHSVALRPVDEVYVVAGNSFRIAEAVFDMAGAGLPSSPDDGQTFAVKNGTFHMTGFTQNFPILTYRVSRTVADHQFIMGDIQIPLRQWASPGRPVHFSVQKLPLWRFSTFWLSRIVKQR